MEEKNIIENLKSNITSVFDLANFDQKVLDFAINSLEVLNEKMKNLKGIDNPNLLPINTITSLKNIQDNESLKPYYEDMYNQCVVLLVSYFSTAISEIFVNNVKYSIPLINDKKILEEELKISIKEIVNLNYNIEDQIGQIIVSRKNISFQDMKSICRSFKEYYGINIKKDKTLNNIIIAQACRHIIIHNSSVIDKRFINQIKDTNPNDFKSEIKLGRKIKFNKKGIHFIGECIIAFVEKIMSDIDKKISKF